MDSVQVVTKKPAITSTRMTRRQANFILQNVKFVVVIGLLVLQVTTFVASLHLPRNLFLGSNLIAERRQDDDSPEDYDEMHPKASENVNNQDDNTGDGYGENEAGKLSHEAESSHILMNPH